MVARKYFPYTEWHLTEVVFFLTITVISLRAVFQIPNLLHLSSTI